MLMEPALDVINRTLQGDASARSFLERTTSIYVLDVSDSSKPKTYGCWNFIHQAMNEMERHESRYLQQDTTRGRDLVGHARLLASMALKVARRSPLSDKSLVATCISNASHYDGSENQSQWLVDLNLELREIVIGRIAAMAFDFSFHRQSGPNGHSAFADRIVMDTCCAILSANAVATGPEAVCHFATEWIIPSSRSLPSFAVASVVLHLASEGTRKSAPSGTKDTLQRLSLPVINIVLVPTLTEAIAGNGSESNGSSCEESSQITAMSLRAMKMWCDATDLSLPQMKHICSKVDINVVEVLSDSMYSDSHQVIDALAELIEATVQISDDKVISPGRMSQVRHIIQVDEISFQAQFTPQQLKTIESHEMATIVEDLISAIGLQRFRFTERQENGDYDLCRNLARIAASVCDTWVDIVAQEQPVELPETGVIHLLMKAAGHPSVNLCAICLQVLTRVMPIIPSLAQELLPTLQRRAITPHHLNDGFIGLDASDLCGVTFHEFQNFRSTVLSEALIVCWRGYGDHFMDSCTSAVEEFCSSSSSVNVSLPLEAALFCIEQVAAEALNSHRPFAHTEQMRRLLAALPAKPPSLLSNPLTRERMCRFLRKYSQWCTTNGRLEAAADLVMSSFRIAISSDPNVGMLSNSVREFSLSSIHEASLALKVIICSAPRNFTNDSSIASLSALWEASYTAVDCFDVIRVVDRVAVCGGLCYMLAALSDDQQMREFEALASLPLGRLERLTTIAKNSQSFSQLFETLPHVGDEICILSSLSRSFTNARAGYEIGKKASTDKLAPIPESVLQVIHRGWPSIAYAAANWADEEKVACGLKAILSDLLPSTCDDDSIKLLRVLCSLASSILRMTSKGRAHFEVVFCFISKFVVVHGEVVEKTALATLSGSPVQEFEKEIGRFIQDMILGTVAAVQESSGNIWTSHGEQRNGQDAFESKQSPATKTQIKSNELLAGILCFLNEALVYCPVFLLHLPCALGGDLTDDMLLRRAIKSAVAGLYDSDLEITRSAITFLKTLAQHYFSRHASVQSYVSESLCKIRADAIGRLVLGSCGKYEHKVLADVAELLTLLLRTSSTRETEAYLVASLRQDHFLLGDRARNVALGILIRSGVVQQNALSSSDLALFLEDVWQLHQSEDTDALPGSDEVARFVLRYS